MYLTNHDYQQKWEIRQETKEFWKQRRLEEETELNKEERIRSINPNSRCTKCYMVRSVLEVQNNVCDNCG